MSAGCEAKPHNPKRKRAKGFEPSTFGMEGRRSTTELRPRTRAIIQSVGVVWILTLPTIARHT